MKYKLEERTTTSQQNRDKMGGGRSATNTTTQLIKREKDETTEEEDNCGEEEEPSSILNYLISRLSEQHKTKLEKHAVVRQRPNEPPKSLSREHLATINNEFEQFERHLFEKYGLPLVEYNSNKAAALATSDLDEDDDFIPADGNGMLPDSSYVLTRSLYAEHKTINLSDSNASTSPTNNSLGKSRSVSAEPQLRQKHQQQQPAKNKMITALSINEIETRKSINFDDGILDYLTIFRAYITVLYF